MTKSIRAKSDAIIGSVNSLGQLKDEVNTLLPIIDDVDRLKKSDLKVELNRYYHNVAVAMRQHIQSTRKLVKSV